MSVVVCLSAMHAAIANDDSLLWSDPTGSHLPLAITADARDEATLYVALKTGGVSVLQQRGQGSPTVLANVSKADLGGLDAMNLRRGGKRLYVALGDHFAAGGAHAGLAIIDIAKPRRPRVVSVWKSAGKGNGAADVAVDGDVAYDAGGLRVIDIRDPRKPREIGRYINPDMGNKAQAYNNVVIEGGHAYAAVNYSGMEIIDIANPAAMRQVGWWNPWHCERFANLWFNSGGHTNQIEVDIVAHRAYLRPATAK